MQGDLRVTGGEIGPLSWRPWSNLQVADIRDGDFVGRVELRGHVKASGGRFDGPIVVAHPIDFESTALGELHLLGDDFALDGVLLDLEVDVPLTVTDRDVTLTATLADGSPFSMDLNTTEVDGEDYIAPHVTLTVTRVIPEPAGCVLMAYAVGVLGANRWNA